MADRGTYTFITLPTNHIYVNPSAYTPRTPYVGINYGEQTSILGGSGQSEIVIPKTTGQLWPRGDLS